jgi:hypothetical protein
VCSVYVSPTAHADDHNSFSDSLTAIVAAHSALHPTSPITLGGDFNAQSLSFAPTVDGYGRQLDRFLASSGLFLRAPAAPKARDKAARRTQQYSGCVCALMLWLCPFSLCGVPPFGQDGSFLQ